MSIITDKFSQLVWDYHLTPTEFEAILYGHNTSNRYLNQTWAITRVLENLNYYDAITLVPLDLLKRQWPKIKSKLFKPAIIKGYEFVLHQHSLSSPRSSPNHRPIN